MFTSEQFVKLCKLPHITFKTLFYFMSDSRMVDPVRLVGVQYDGQIIPDPVIWEVIYMNGF